MDSDTVPLVVGITYNLKKGIKSDVEDIEAEYDSIDTVKAISEALEKAGCKVELFEADDSVLDRLRRNKADIIFNIAEGIQGRGREAELPSILNFLKIPFTGSDETTLCISLDKALTKRLLASYKIRTPKYQVVTRDNPKLNSRMSFPLIVKPNAEGSSKGISDMAVVYDRRELNQLLDRNFRDYNQAFLVEEYIHGREFTVGIVGNGKDAQVFSPMEIIYKKPGKHNIYSFNVKKNYKEYIEYKCPASVDSNIEGEMMDTARKIYQILDCKDFSRIDFRLSDDNKVHFIEINPLPGLAPGYSDYPMLAGFCGVGYQALIKRILNSALKRYGKKEI